MDSLVLLRAQVTWTNDLMTRVFSAVTPEQAVWKPSGATVNSIATTFLHAYHSEDQIIHGRLHQPTVFERGGWRERLGFDPTAQWLAQGDPDLTAYRSYAAAISEATNAYFDSIASASLDDTVESPRGPSTLAMLLTRLLIVHKASHMGEIAALLGSQGVKGFPF